MTLKEKFKPFAMDNHIEKYAEYNSKELEKIAEDFAIRFAEWFNNLKYDVMRYKTMEEHLEIYKKEKGL